LENTFNTLAQVEKQLMKDKLFIFKDKEAMENLIYLKM
jgi:hypothetical protein